jgi:hypothetical protein
VIASSILVHIYRTTEGLKTFILYFTTGHYIFLGGLGLSIISIIYVIAASIKNNSQFQIYFNLKLIHFYNFIKNIMFCF